MFEYEVKYKCGCGPKINTMTTGLQVEEIQKDNKITKCNDCEKKIEISRTNKKEY